MMIKEKISSGTFLWEAMKPYNDAFPDIYISMIRAGEAAGALDVILKRLIKYLDDAYKLKKLVKGAMIYPIVDLGRRHRRRDDHAGFRHPEVRRSPEGRRPEAARADPDRHRSRATGFSATFFISSAAAA